MQTLGIKSIKRLGVQKTLDFKVNHSLHNFIAEGIVVSNSHSVSYASLSALTVYLKFNYPKEFYCSLLKESKEEPKPLEEIAKIHAELKNFGIKLLPPHLTKSDIEFKLEDGNIRFGLNSIKGVSEKSVEGLKAFCSPKSNKYELFNSAKEAGLNIGILCALIHCGALDDQKFSKSRARLALEAQLWNILTEKEKKLCFERGDQFQFDLLKTVYFLKHNNDSKGKLFIKESRFETISKKYEPFKEIFNKNEKYARLSNFFYERLLTGVSFSTNLYEVFKDEPGIRNLRSIQECIDAEDGDFLEFVGIVNEEKSWTSKKGNKCLKLSLTDGVSNIECMVSNNKDTDKIEEMKNYNQGNLPKENDILHCTAKKFKGSIFLNKVAIQSVKIWTKYAALKKARDKEESSSITQ